MESYQAYGIGGQPELRCAPVNSPFRSRRYAYRNDGQFMQGIIFLLFIAMKPSPSVIAGVIRDI